MYYFFLALSHSNTQDPLHDLFCSEGVRMKDRGNMSEKETNTERSMPLF